MSLMRARPIVDTSEIITDADSDAAAFEALKPGDWVQLRRRPMDHEDKHAVCVFDYKGRRLGRLRSDLAKRVGTHIVAGWRTFCLVSQVAAARLGTPAQGSVIVFCYDHEEDEQVRPALLDLSTRIRKGMLQRSYVATPAPRHRGAFHDLPVNISTLDEPAYRLHSA
jgi:hypothetical protein